MSQEDYQTLLGFTDRWLSLGILTEDGLQHYGVTYEASANKNAEHYRYGAFRWYLKKHRPLPAPIAEALYELGASDLDLGEAMMADILCLPECPASVSAKALASGSQPLVRVAERQGLLSEIRQAPLTAELLNRCVESRDSAVQRALLEGGGLLPEQLQVLAERGASRAVRNMASSGLRFCREAAPSGAKAGR